MDAKKIQQLCENTWKPFQKKYPHLAEDAISTAVLATLEAFLINNKQAEHELERIARSAMFDYIEDNT